MKSLRILMIIPYLPNQKNVTTVLAKNILESLKKKCDPHLIWILQTPKQKFTNDFPNIDIKPIQSYTDACDLIDKEHPDVILLETSFAYSSYPFLIAGRYKKILTVGYLLYGVESNDDVTRNSRVKTFTSKILRFFSKPIGNFSEQKTFGKGRFYLYKYIFLLKTLRAMKISKLSLFYNILENVWLNSLGIMDKNRADPRLFTDVICLPTKSWLPKFHNAGCPKEKLHVTGSPLFDRYDVDLIPDRTIDSNLPVRILLITASLNTHGLLTNQQQAKLVSQIIKILTSDKNKFKLSIKIHPTSENLEFYEKIISKIGINVPLYQKEDLRDLLKNNDVAVYFGIFSTSNVDVLISGVPHVILTVGKTKSIVVSKYKVAIECKSVLDLIPSIEKSLKERPFKENIKNFLNDISYPFDGKASDRFTDVILSLSKN